jgi:hypothetical protein
MMKIGRTTIPALIIGILLCLSCSNPREATEGSSSAPAKPAPGVSGSLQVRDGAGLYNVEMVGNTANPLMVPSVAVGLGAVLAVQGWGVDPDSKKAAEAVEVVVDGTPYPAQYGLPRGDVADHYKVPDYAKAGFDFAAPARAFGKGEHKIAVRFIASDKKTYYESNSITVEIK